MRRDRQGNLPCFFVFTALVAVLVAGSSALAEGIWSEAPVPPVTQMNSTAFFGRANAWAVGNLGNILRYQNGTWAIFPSGTDKNLYGVFAQGERNAWAVGAEGTIMHWDGDRWALHPSSGSATTKDLFAVAFINENNGWAAGGGTAGGVILHYDGTSWSAVQSLTSTVTGIAAVTSDYIWFCGFNRTLTLFNGTAFVPGPDLVGDGKAWNAVAFPYSRLGWVVGDDGKVARFSPGKYPSVQGMCWGTYYVDSNGVATTTGQGYAATAAQLKGLCVLADPEWGYLVGSGGLRMRLGEDGRFLQEVIGGVDLADIDLPNHEEGAAVGGSALTGPRAVLLRVRTTAAAFSGMRVFPNPFEPVKGGYLTIDRLPGNVSSIEIFTVEGDKIASIGKGIDYRPDFGVATWNGKIGGNLAASGAYVARISAPGLKTKTAAFLVVKR